MSKALALPEPMPDTPDAVEVAFYDALRLADIDRLMACWADEDDIVCIHPGGPRVTGCSAIRAAFEAIFTHSGSIQVRPESIRRLATLGSAVHCVLERVEMASSSGPLLAYVIATNVYHQTPQGWRLVLHHASPGALDEVQEVNSISPVLH
jgi:ketosteroid isomerase-like protein